MSDERHDAASVVGQMAGLGAKPAPEPVTPEQLAKAFTTNVPEGLVGQTGAERDDAKRCTIYRGFCGYSGGRGDSLETGFDDGYDFMGYLEGHGWQALAAKGDWPYVVYVAYKAREPYAIASYVECDFTLWIFDDGQAAQAFYRELPDEDA